MKKIIVLLLMIAILTSSAIADNISNYASSDYTIAMLDDINNNTSDLNPDLPEEPIIPPIENGENDNEPVDIISEEPSPEVPTPIDIPGPIIETPVIPVEENKPPEVKQEIPQKPTPRIITTLNKENAWAHKTVYLTFDDGPSPLSEKVLDVLKKEEVKATFFVIGTKTDEGKSTLKRIVDEGHSLGNHTYGHKYNYIYKSTENFFSDLYKNEYVIYESTRRSPKIIRFPGGSNNSATKSEKGKKVMNEIMDRLEREGYVYFDWNASSGDASAQTASVDDIINNVLTWVGKNNNAVVLFHDTVAKTNTLKALPTIIEKLKFLGCKFEILTTSSPQVAFVKNNSSSKKPESVTASTKERPRKPPHVVNKLMKLELEMEKRFNKSKY